MGPIDHGRLSGHLTQGRLEYTKGSTHGSVRENQEYCEKRLVIWKT